NRAVNSSVPPVGVGYFAGDPERVLDRTRKLFGGLRSAHERVTVRSAREWIGVPVVRPEAFDLRLHATLADAEILRQRSDGAIAASHLQSRPHLVDDRGRWRELNRSLVAGSEENVERDGDNRRARFNRCGRAVLSAGKN